jgi:hypothetical protein
MGSDIFKITEKYDDMVLGYLKLHKETKYIFLSSGAVYDFILRLKSEKLYPLFFEKDKIKSCAIRLVAPKIAIFIQS